MHVAPRLNGEPIRRNVTKAGFRTSPHRELHTSGDSQPSRLPSLTTARHRRRILRRDGAHRPTASCLACRRRDDWLIQPYEAAVGVVAAETGLSRADGLLLHSSSQWTVAATQPSPCAQPECRTAQVRPNLGLVHWAIYPTKYPSSDSEK